MVKQQQTLTLEAPITLEASADKVKVKIVAYTGGVMRLPGVPIPVVISLEGMAMGGQVPLLADHENDLNSVVGHGSPEVSNGQLLVAGVASGASPKGASVISLAKDGFQFQSSVGATATEYHVLEAGQSEVVNGRKVTAGREGLMVADKTTLREVTITALGCDPNTSVTIAASRGKQNMADIVTNDGQILEIKAALKAEMRAEFMKIEAACDGLEFINADLTSRVKELKAKAHSGDINFVDLQAGIIKVQQDDVKLTRKMGERPQGPGIHMVDNTAQGLVLEAALCMQIRTPNLEKHFKPEVLEAAASKRWRTLGLKETVMLCAQAQGWSGGMNDVSGALRACSLVMNAASSTISLPNIFSNIANKEIAQGYSEVDETWREFSAIKTNSDYKPHTTIRLLDDMEYEELGPNGEIAHGDIGEEVKTRSVKRYAKMFALPIEAFVNDDKQALADIRARLGRGSARKLNKLWWTTFLNGKTTLFPVNGSLGNYLSGATSNFLINGVGLELAVQKFRKLRSADDKRIDGPPVKILVPPTSEFIADRVVAPVQAATAADINVHSGKYQVFTHDYLEDSSFNANYSTLQWGIFRNPSILAPMIVSFLNGQEQPIVEESAAEFNTYGIQFRGAGDFGCDLGDGLSGVWSKGAA